MFKHRMLPELEVEVVTTPKGRYYKIYDGTLLPSVTTILGRMVSKDGLAAWRKRIGNPEADRISDVARQRGSILHDAVEKLVLNESIPNLVFAEQAMFEGVKPFLEKNIGTVFGVETPLYSKSLMDGGTRRPTSRMDGGSRLSTIRRLDLKKRKNIYFHTFFNR